jgi:hypothetical protein
MFEHDPLMRLGAHWTGVHKLTVNLQNIPTPGGSITRPYSRLGPYRRLLALLTRTDLNQLQCLRSMRKLTMPLSTTDRSTNIVRRGPIT